MSVRDYTVKGEVFYKVDVVRKSKFCGIEVRERKRKNKIHSFEEAKDIEAKLIKEASRLLMEKEQNGLSWSAIVDQFELASLEESEFVSNISRQTKKEYVGIVRKHTSSWYKLPASAISQSDVIELLERATGMGLSRARLKSIRTAIDHVFRWGIKKNLVKYLKDAPTVGVSVPKDKEEKIPEILTSVQAETLLREAHRLGHEWYSIWAMAILTGMRSGELFALEWSDVDFDGMKIWVKKSYNFATHEIKSTKSGNWRIVPINAQLHALLNDLKATRGFERNVLPRINYWRRGEASKVIRHFLESIGLPSVRFHALRSCFATFMLSKGVSPVVVIRIGGWAEIKTMQIYTRLAGVDVKGATDNLIELPSNSEAQVIDLNASRE